MRKRTQGTQVLFVALLWAVAWMLFSAQSLAEETGGDWGERKFIAPLNGESYLWAPVLPLMPDNELLFKFHYSYHRLFSNTEVKGSAFSFVLAGEYTFFKKLTVGLDIPFIVGYGASYNAGGYNWSDSGADFGNIRFHFRYPLLERPDLGFVFTPAFRVWLPSNTFLTVDSPLGSATIINSFAVFELMLLQAGYVFTQVPVSIQFETGPKFFAVRDKDDFSFWSINLVIGSDPIASLKELELVIEYNMLIELTKNEAYRATSDDHIVPIALSVGGRYHIGAFSLGLTLRIGLNVPEIYFGNVNIGLQVGYTPNF